MSSENEVGPVLYSDETLAVVNKRIGEICEGGEKSNAGLLIVNRVRPLLEERLQRKLTALEAVHRLDQPVSGCLLLAFDRASFAALSAEFSSGAIRKKYWAIVEKSSRADLSGRLEHMIRFDAKHHKATAVPSGEVRSPGPEWKRAALSWTLIGSGDRYDFLEIVPETGRTHQIRAQLAAAGMVIKGDLKYGARRSDPRGGIRLHARAIQFRHPATNEVLTISAPIEDIDPLWSAFSAAAR